MADPTNNPNYPSYQTYPTGSGFLGTQGPGDYMLKLGGEILNVPSAVVGATNTVISPALNYERAIFRKGERDAFLGNYNGSTPGFKTILATTYAARQRASGK